MNGAGRRLGWRVAPVLLTAFLGGCGTIGSIENNEPFPNIVYGGVRNEVTPTLSPHAIFDFPFSAVADTLALPYTIVTSRENAAHPEDKPRYDELGDWIPPGSHPTTRPAPCN